MFGALSFLNPWLLLLLLSLPVLWWLLRLTPPSPRRVYFPAIRLLFGLQPKEETPQHTPWWLLLLRLSLAALMIIAFAHPVHNEERPFARAGGVLILMDNDWASAASWEEHRQLAEEILTEAERSGRQTALLFTAENESNLIFEDGRTNIALLQNIQPKAWLPDRARILARLEKENLAKDLNIFWISNGLQLSESDRKLADHLEEHGSLTLYRSELGHMPKFFLADGNSNRLAITLARPAGGPDEQLEISAYDQDNHRLGAQPIKLAAGETLKNQKLNWPLELLNRIKRIAINGQYHAGASYLWDGLSGAKPIGFITPDAENSRQALIGPLYFFERALGNSIVRAGPLNQLLAQPLSVLVLPDTTVLMAEERNLLSNWIEKGGMLIRFSGNNLANNRESDNLLPVKLREGVRELGGALSWAGNQSLAPFPDQSPFAGLIPPKDITIRAQLLAEPEIELDRKVWSKLADGTPLVTGGAKGKGFLVLFHTSGNASWSDLVLSGVFVQMLERLIDLSSGVRVQEQRNYQLLPAAWMLDGYGNLFAAAADQPALTIKEITEGPASARHMPGVYGRDEQYFALNATTGLKKPPTLLNFPNMKNIADIKSVDFQPWLLLLALAIFLIDLLFSLFLRGLGLGKSLRRKEYGPGTAAILLMLALPFAAQAQPSDEDIIKKVTTAHLAYVETGSPEVDRISRAGLIGLTGILLTRTSTDIGDPVGVDLESDELSFYPILYWPISAAQPQLSNTAISKINDYLARGGLIFFDTGDRPLNSLGEGEGGPGTARLQELAAHLMIPPLIPIPADHVLGRSFYLLREYPGRWIGGELWVEQKGARQNDGVSSIIIGSNDYAAAWAIDEYGRPLYPVTPGGERQREYAYRFGVNLVMYALTGNYKTDQVHIPAILQRLGQ